jgi:hypothetical protein
VCERERKRSFLYRESKMRDKVRKECNFFPDKGKEAEDMKGR